MSSSRTISSNRIIDNAIAIADDAVSDEDTSLYFDAIPEDSSVETSLESIASCNILQKKKRDRDQRQENLGALLQRIREKVPSQSSPTKNNLIRNTFLLQRIREKEVPRQSPTKTNLVSNNNDVMPAVAPIAPGEIPTNHKNPPFNESCNGNHGDMNVEDNAVRDVLSLPTRKLQSAMQNGTACMQNHLATNQHPQGHEQQQQQQKLRCILEDFLKSPDGLTLLQGLMRNAAAATVAPTDATFPNETTFPTETLPMQDQHHNPELYAVPDRAFHTRDFTVSSCTSTSTTTATTSSQPEESKNYPEDAYSFIALNGPTGKNCWPFRKFVFFLFGLMPFVFQMLLLGLLISHLDVRKDTSEMMEVGMEVEQQNESSHPTDEIRLDIRIAQVVSLAAYLVFPSSTQQDLIKAIQHYPWCNPKHQGIPVGCIRVSCILRFLQSNLALSVVFLLIMQSDSTVDIILNFTAVNFISNLDDDAFAIAKSGIFGPLLKNETKRIENTRLPVCMHRESKHIWYGVVLTSYAAIFFSLMIVMMLVITPYEYFWVTRGLVDFQCGLGVVFLVYSVIRSLRSCCAASGGCCCCKSKRSSSNNNNKPKRASFLNDSERTGATGKTAISSEEFAPSDEFQQL